MSTRPADPVPNTPRPAESPKGAGSNEGPAVGTGTPVKKTPLAPSSGQGGAKKG